MCLDIFLGDVVLSCSHDIWSAFFEKCTVWLKEEQDKLIEVLGHLLDLNVGVRAGWCDIGTLRLQDKVFEEFLGVAADIEAI